MKKIFKIGEILTNYNGYKYQVIDSKKNKTLFVNLDNYEYVVGCHVKFFKDDNKISWAFGHYCNNIIDAFNYYIK